MIARIHFNERSLFSLVDLGGATAGSGVAGMVLAGDGVAAVAGSQGSDRVGTVALTAGRRRIEPLDPKDRLN